MNVRFKKLRALWLANMYAAFAQKAVVDPANKERWMEHAKYYEDKFLEITDPLTIQQILNDDKRNNNTSQDIERAN